MTVHPIGPDEVDAATETIRLAFAQDPVWSVALLPEGDTTDHLAPYWRLYVEGALRHGTVYAGPVEDGRARTVSVWIPPGADELSDEQAGRLIALAREALGEDGLMALVELWGRFEDHHPQREPHYYLSLLATHPAYAGHGLGIAHLAEDLARWDAAGVPSYLESSNPANDKRYESLGYRRVGQFETVLDHAVVGCYWRPVGG